MDKTKDTPKSCTLYEACGNLSNNSTRIRRVQADMHTQNPLYGFTFMASPDDDNMSFTPTHIGTNGPVGSVLSYQLALTEGNFNVDLNLSSLDRSRCTLGCIVRDSPYPSLPMNKVRSNVIIDSKIVYLLSQSKCCSILPQLRHSLLI